ncbi:MAG TPA: sigma-70 family RNA polymerase sigma factor [Planctomycetota bacterium]
MSNPSIADVLLTHADFVRRLAHGLAGAEGDDLAQDAFVSALQSPPARAGNLRAWLAAITRNVLHNRLRTAARRRRHEGAAEVQPALPAADEIAEREEVRARVVAAVLQLAAPLREVVLLRFYEGLDSPAIGRRLGRADSTVRTQLATALERLRRRLDAEHGERRALWALPLLRWRPAAEVTGMLRVVWPVRAALLAALVLVGLFGVPPLLQPGAGPRPLPPTTIASEAPRRDAAPAAAANERTAAPAIVAADPARGREDLWGIVVTAADERPVAGAEVRLLRCDADELDNYDVEYQKRVATLATARSDAAGRFAFRVARACHHRLGVRASGFAEATVFRCVGGSEQIVRVAPATALEGVVREKETGLPLGGARVGVYVFGAGRYQELASTETAPDGSFRFGDLPPGEMVVAAQPQDLCLASVRVMLEASRVQFVELSVARGRTMSGRVTEAETGAAIEGAEISDVWNFDRTVRTTADGEYELHGLGWAGDVFTYNRVFVRAQGFARQVQRVPAEADAPRIDFELVRGGAVRGRFVDGTGLPVSAIYAAAAAEWPGSPDCDWLPITVAHDGRFEVGQLDPRPLYQIHARGDGFGSRVYALPRRAAEGTTVDLGDIVLQPATLFEARVVDGEGRPLAGAAVTWRGHNGDALEYRKRVGLPHAGVQVLHSFTTRRTSTASDGTFGFAGLAAGSYTLSVQPAGVSWTADSGPYTLRDGEVRSEQVVIDFGLSITGRVRGADLAAMPANAQFRLRARSGAGSSQVAQVNADGTFRFDRLARGGHVLSASRPPAGFALVPVRGVAAGASDIELRLQPAAVIEGKLVDADGKPVLGLVCYWPGEDVGGSAANHQTDAEGRFRLEVPPGYVGTISARDASGSREAAVENVAAGTPDLVIRLR